MAGITIRVTLQPYEYDLIVDSLQIMISRIEDELANPLSEISEDIRTMSEDQIEAAKCLLRDIFDRES